MGLLDVDYYTKIQVEESRKLRLECDGSSLSKWMKGLFV